MSLKQAVLPAILHSHQKTPNLIRPRNGEEMEQTHLPTSRGKRKNGSECQSLP